jgi:glycosyltransferase involved in cell wall biosynthesis
MSYGYVCLKAADDVPVVVSIHGIVREELRLANTRLTLQAALAGVPLQRYCLRHARYLTQPTTYPARYFGNAIQGTIVDVGNAVSNEFFSVTPTPEAGRVLYVGGVFERKRVLELVEAIARVRPSVPNVSLHICGEERSGAYAEKVRQRVRELQLENAVTFLGGVSASQLVTEYSRAAVFALASGRETSPISIVEAMAVGVPVLATEVGGIPELIRDGGGIVVPLNDRDAFDEGLVELLTHDERRRSCSEAGRARANLFRRDVVAERVRDLYEAATTRL